MWNMMCDVMPTISEDSISQRSSQFSGEDANFEQLMVSMLDERDKLVESLRETQERLNDSEVRLKDVEKERDSLQRQIAANLPQRLVKHVVCDTRSPRPWEVPLHCPPSPPLQY
ncbi:Liprin-alpha-2 [Papilio machaon]|uniref:Liprin-alpha-2 n=1 Tax=Papilio machaon TaxID=76193 RepID=A0A194RF14_PAPMA|nr:Liprin-alpha-2 [Papilio machaon]